MPICVMCASAPPVESIPTTENLEKVADTTLVTESPKKVHFEVLDGWRGISILLVLAAHLLPLGPKIHNMNENTGILGMVIFFILSGFLITSFLLSDQNVLRFLTRRFFRVMPLALLYLVLILFVNLEPLNVWVTHLLFVANLPPATLTPLTAHLWSICVEVQFYVGVALLVFVLKRRGLFLLPIFALGFTLLRVVNGVHASSISYYRIDEILAGCWLALMLQHAYKYDFIQFFKKLPQPLLLIFLALSCMSQGQWLNYFRPYLAALLVGATIANPSTGLVKILKSRIFLFTASISYALYIIHPAVASTWLGTGDTYEKYAKRALLFPVVFLLAYFSTKFYEWPLINYGKLIGEKLVRSVMFQQTKRNLSSDK